VQNLYLFYWSHGTYHNKIIIPFCDNNDYFIMDVSSDYFQLLMVNLHEKAPFAFFYQK